MMMMMMMTARHLSPSRNTSTIIYSTYFFTARIDCVKRPCIACLGRLYDAIISSNYIYTLYITIHDDDDDDDDDDAGD